MSAFITRRGGSGGGGGELNVITGSMTVSSSALNVNTFPDLIGKKYWVMETPMSGTGTTTRGIYWLLYNDGAVTAVYKYAANVTRKTIDPTDTASVAAFFDPTTGKVDIYGIPGANDSDWQWYKGKSYNYTIFG